MIKVGLSGNRYSGKTFVSKLFKQIGIPVFNADVILKFILSRDLQTLDLVKNKVGHQVFTLGHIDSSKVTDAEFENILQCAKHSLLKAYDAFNKRNPKSIYTVFNSSFLFETDFAESMDYNISVFCPKTIRMQRCKQITNMRASNIAYMLRNEMDDIDKNKMSYFVIHNYENMDTLNQVNKIDLKIVDLYLKDKF